MLTKKITQTMKSSCPVIVLTTAVSLIFALCYLILTFGEIGHNGIDEIDEATQRLLFEYIPTDTLLEFTPLRNEIIVSESKQEVKASSFIYHEIFDGSDCHGDVTRVEGYAAGQCIQVYNEITGALEGSLIASCDFGVSLERFSSSNCDPSTVISSDDSATTSTCMSLDGNPYGKSYHVQCGPSRVLPIRHNSVATLTYSDTSSCVAEMAPIAFEATSLKKCIDSDLSSSYVMNECSTETEPIELIFASADTCSKGNYDTAISTRAVGAKCAPLRQGDQRVRSVQCVRGISPAEGYSAAKHMMIVEDFIGNPTAMPTAVPTKFWVGLPTPLPTRAPTGRFSLPSAMPTAQPWSPSIPKPSSMPSSPTAMPLAPTSSQQPSLAPKEAPFPAPTSYPLRSPSLAPITSAVTPTPAPWSASPSAVGLTPSPTPAPVIFAASSTLSGITVSQFNSTLQSAFVAAVIAASQGSITSVTITSITAITRSEATATSFDRASLPTPTATSVITGAAIEEGGVWSAIGMRGGSSGAALRRLVEGGINVAFVGQIAVSPGSSPSAALQKTADALGSGLTAAVQSRGGALSACTVTVGAVVNISPTSQPTAAPTAPPNVAPTLPPGTKQAPRKKNQTGAIVGGIVGGVGGFLLVVGAFYAYLVNKRASHTFSLVGPSPTPQQGSNPMVPVVPPPRYPATFSPVSPATNNPVPVASPLRF